MSAVAGAAIRFEGVTKVFQRKGQPPVVAVNEVSFEVPTGATLGLVGESGSGKSTVARCLLGLTPTDSGRIEVLGRQITDAKPRDLRSWRKDMQIVFQEPYESLDPRLRVGAAIAEPLILHTGLRGGELRRRVLELLEHVQLRPEHYARFPSELSGGQQQRVNIARAIAVHPSVVVLDEPTSSLDVSVRAGILKLMVRLQQELELTYVFISHDLPTIRAVCDWVAVMYLGRIVEIGPAQQVLAAPAHPYTELLLNAELSHDADAKPVAQPVRGEARVSGAPSAGCIFAPRCPRPVAVCAEVQPPLLSSGGAHGAACVWVEPERYELSVGETVTAAGDSG
jgi:peptide/nickel transport system ATP-binding protein/oligopeptide transport system ATP-binding protein